MEEAELMELETFCNEPMEVGDKFTAMAALEDKLEITWWDIWYAQCFDAQFPFERWKHGLPNLRVGGIVRFGCEKKVVKGEYRLTLVCETRPDVNGLVRDVVVEFTLRGGRKGLPYTSVNLERKRLPVQRLVLFQPVEASDLL